MQRHSSSVPTGFIASSVTITMTVTSLGGGWVGFIDAFVRFVVSYQKFGQSDRPKHASTAAYPIIHPSERLIVVIRIMSSALHMPKR